jgi:hypothetical protein
MNVKLPTTPLSRVNIPEPPLNWLQEARDTAVTSPPPESPVPPICPLIRAVGPNGNANAAAFCGSYDGAGDGGEPWHISMHSVVGLTIVCDEAIDGMAVGLGVVVAVAVADADGFGAGEDPEDPPLQPAAKAAHPILRNVSLLDG